jgi:hypothetical protein
MALSHRRKVWFGYKDSWICETEDYFHWDLKGYYGDLEEVLSGNYRRGPERITVSKPSSISYDTD